MHETELGPQLKIYQKTLLSHAALVIALRAWVSISILLWVLGHPQWLKWAPTMVFGHPQTLSRHPQRYYRLGTHTSFNNCKIRISTMVGCKKQRTLDAIKTNHAKIA